MADMLRQGKEGANKLNAFGIGAGDLIFGDAPEAAEAMSYGEIPHKGAGQTYQLDPSVADLGMLVSAPAAGTLKATQQAGKTMAKTLRDQPLDVSRRQALGTIAKGAGAVGALATAPAMALRAMGKGAAKLAPEAGTVVKAAAKAIPKVSVTPLVNGIAKNILKWSGSWNSLAGKSDEAMNAIIKKMNPEDLESLHDYAGDMIRKHGDDLDMEGYFKRTDMGEDAVSSKELGLVDWKPGMKGMDENPAMSYLDDLENGKNADPDKMIDMVETWEATGKWPKGMEDTMKYFDRQWWREGHMDWETGAMRHEEDFLRGADRLKEAMPE